MRVHRMRGQIIATPTARTERRYVKIFRLLVAIMTSATVLAALILSPGPAFIVLGGISALWLLRRSG